MSKRLTAIGFTAMFVALVAPNVLLLGQNLQMRRALERYEPRGLKVGEAVEPFTAEGLDGLLVEVGYAPGGRKKVLLYFTPSCAFCHQQFPRWRELIERARDGRFEVIGLADQEEERGRLRAYLREMGCGDDAETPLRVGLVPREVRQRYKLHATPITVVVGGAGEVEQVWEGRWSEEVAAEAGAALGLGFAAR